jgi:hypothetical protein
LSGLHKLGLRAGRWGPQKSPEIGNFILKKILTPKLVSKVLYYAKWHSISNQQAQK